MYRQLRWVLIGLGIATLATGGTSIFWRPDHEVLYGGGAPLTTCLSEDCIFIYTFEVGNTGQQSQEQVEVRLRAAYVDAAMLPVKIRNFGKVDRAVQIERNDDVITYRLGPMKRGERLDVQLILRDKDPRAAPPWDQIFLSVVPTKGEAKPGNPGGVLLGRMLHTFFGVGW